MCNCSYMMESRPFGCQQAAEKHEVNVTAATTIAASTIQSFNILGTGGTDSRVLNPLSEMHACLCVIGQNSSLLDDFKQQKELDQIQLLFQLRLHSATSLSSYQNKSTVLTVNYNHSISISLKSEKRLMRCW